MSSSRPALGTRATYALVGVVVVGVALVWSRVAVDLGDRRPAYVAPFTAQELRDRPDITDVVPTHARAAQAAMEAIGETAGVTWGTADAQVFTHQRDGRDEQVVDGHPALRWTPDHWTTTGPAALDDASVERLAGAWRQTLEPLNYTVSTVNRSTARNRHLVTFSASDEHQSSLQLFDDGDGGLRLIVRSYVHLYRSDTCAPDPLTCVPDVAALTEALPTAS